MTDARIASRRRWLLPSAIALALLLVAILPAGVPWGMLRGLVERRLSGHTGRTVTIGAMARTDWLSWYPTVVIRDLRIAGTGADVARIAEARIRFPVLPLLIGRFRPSAVELSGMHLALVRDAAGNENWHARPEEDGAGKRPSLRLLTVRDSSIDYRDFLRDRGFVARIAADARGLRLEGTGHILAAPVRIVASGPPIDGAAHGAAWPFRVAVIGDTVGMTLDGRMDGPLDAAHFTAAASGHAKDFVLLDAIIESGLPATQPVRFTAQVRRDATDWRVTGLRGTVGRSDVAGSGTLIKRGGRTRVDAALTAERFDFADLASDEQHRIARLKEARLGPRLLPDTQIDLSRLANTDGTLAVRVRRLLWPGSSPFRNLATTFTLDHSRLEVAPLMLGLTNGTLTGRVSVDQRHGGPLLDARLVIERARMIDFFPAAAIDASLRGRIMLAGPGRTIREGIGRSSGTIGLVARDGIIPARSASLLGQDLGRGITSGKDERAALRCIVARFAVTNGVARPDPVLIDTSRALTRASGAILLADERLALRLSGAPKKDSLLRITGRMPVGGTIEYPAIRVPQQARSAGGILKMLGNAIDGRNAPLASDLDCDAEIARVLR